MARAKNRIRAAAAAGTPSDDAVNGAFVGLSPEAEILAPSEDSAKRMAQRTAVRVRGVPAQPQRLEDFRVSQADASFPDDSPFLLKDEGAGRQRFLLFSSVSLLERLRESERVASDGTFRVVPRLFRQLWTLCAEVDGRMVPVIWVLMGGQGRREYDLVLQAIRDLVPGWTPRVWLSDFERAAMNSVEATWPGCRAVGCTFHLSQRIVKWVAEEGLNAPYRVQGSTLPLWTRSLAALTLVPRREVDRAFEALTQHPDFDRRAVPIYEKFQRLYLGRQVFGQRERPRFAKRRWSHYRDTLAYEHAQRSNNTLEGYHNRLRALLRAHPNVVSLIRKLRSEALRSERRIRLYAIGDEPRRRRRQIQADRRIRRLCQTFQDRDLVTHIHAIARHLHS